MALLSMLKDQEVDKPKFGWWEKRMELHQTLTVANTTGAFGDTAATPVDKADGFDPAAGSAVTIFVADATQFRERDTIWVRNCPNEGATANLQIKGVVSAVDTVGGYLTESLFQRFQHR
jgi:hypothetical protein